MGLIRRFGTLLRLASGVLARACCCGGDGCCFVDGIPAPQYTSENECEQCLTVRCTEWIAFPDGGTCPDGWNAVGGIGCWRYRMESACDRCQPSTAIIPTQCETGFPATGPCGTWTPDITCPVCVYACYSHPDWIVSSSPCAAVPSPGPSNGCDFILGQVFIPKPDSFDGKAVAVTVIGDFDDDIAINGVVVGPPCRGAGPVSTSFTLIESVNGFTLGAVDSFGINCQGSLRVCFSSTNPLP